MSLEVTKSNYDEVVNSEKLVVLDFYAPWCGPCKFLSPTIDQLSEEFSDKGVTIGKIDVDAQPDLSEKYGIRNVPTVLFLKGGEVIDRKVGAVTKPVLTQIINEHIG